MTKDRIKCYDAGKKVADRYTVVFMDRPERTGKLYEALSMSAEPFHPLGIGQHCSAAMGGHLGLRITLNSMPKGCQLLVARCLE